MSSIAHWPASVWVAIGLAPFAGSLLYGFIKESKERSWIGLAAALLAHLGFVLLVPFAEPEDEDPVPRIIELEVYTPPEPEPPPPEPEPEPEPELEPPTEVPQAETPKPPEPKRPKPRRKRAPKPSQPAPENDTPPAPKRFDMSQLNQGSSSGVTVHAGSGGGNTLDGNPNGSGTGRRRPAKPTTEPPGAGGGDASKGRGWAPASQVLVQRLPVPKSVPRRECPATKDGVEGTVFLTVQVRRDGSVRKVKVTKGIGHGCDAIAAAALRKAKFKPAQSNANKAVDFEIRYEYVFRLAQ